MRIQLLASLGILWSTCAPAQPAIQILRPNSFDRLQPGTNLRIQWRILGTNIITHGDWNFFFDTNDVQVGRVFPVAINDGGGYWHADLSIPNEVHPDSRWDETRVELPSACSYTLRIHEDVSEADGASDVFCLGVPEVSVKVSQVQVCWTSRSNRIYQVQFRSALTGNAWSNLGERVQGNGSTNYVTDAVIPGQPQKYYRVQEVP